MLRRFGIALLVASFGAVSAGAVTGCADDEKEQVEVSVTERDLSPGRVQVSDGEIEFVVTNDGDRRHAFAVETPDGIERTDAIDPGEEERLTVTLSEGRYRMYDPRGDYRADGVRGTVVVTDDDTATVTDRTVTEHTVEEDAEDPPDVEEPPPVTVTEREVQPAPRPRRPQPAPTPPRTVTEQVPVEPPPPTPPPSP